MQQTLHPFLARPRPASAIAHAVAFSAAVPERSASAGCSKRDCTRGRAEDREASARTQLYDVQGGTDDESSTYLESDVEQAILDDVAEQAHDLALSQAHAPLSFEPALQAPVRRAAGTSTVSLTYDRKEEREGDHTKEVVGECSSNGAGTSEDKWANATSSLAPFRKSPVPRRPRACNIPKDLPSLSAALSRRKPSIHLESACAHQWLGTMAVEHATCITGKGAGATAVGLWELAADAGGAFLNLTLRNEHDSTVAITGGTWQFERTSVRCAGAAVFRGKFGCDSWSKTTAVFCAGDARLGMGDSTLGGMSVRESASWGLFCSAFSRASIASCCVELCAECGVTCVASAQACLSASAVDACAVALCVDDSASLHMQGGGLERNDFALEAGFSSGAAAALALDRVLVRGPQTLWRSDQRPARLETSRLHIVAGGASRPKSSSFSFSSRVFAPSASLSPQVAYLIEIQVDLTDSHGVWQGAARLQSMQMEDSSGDENNKEGHALEHILRGVLA